MYAKEKGVSISGQNTYERHSQGIIKIDNEDSGEIYGVVESLNSDSYSEIILTNRKSGKAIGVQGTIASKNDNIFIYNHENGTVLGLQGGNNGNVSINNYGNRTAIEMYAPAGSIAKNSGTITIKREAVTIDDTVYIPSSSTGGTVTAAKGAKFNIAGTLSGTLNVSSDYVSGGFDTVYTARDVINAGDTAKLNLASESALFDVSLADNKQDIVLRMKSFNAATNNRSLERFLENNYANARNENFFNTLKAATSVSGLKSTLNKLTGENGLKRFISDDLSALRANKFALNNEIFSHNSNEKNWAFLGDVALFGFKNDNSSNSRAALLNNRISDKLSVGYGMSYSAVSTNDAKGNNRKSSAVQFYIPMTYSNKALRFVSMPSFGYAKNNYTRSGFDMSYNGEIESRTFAFANESRYKIESAGLTIEPAAEFNAVVYNQSGKEDIKAFALTIPNATSLSVEGGAGIHLSNQIQTDKNISFAFKTGAMFYHEFAKPYNVKLGMNGMQGTFDLYDDTKRNRAEISFGLAYKRKNVDLFADIRHFAETETHTYIKIGATLDF